MIPKWFCPGIILIMAILLYEPASWLTDQTFVWICRGIIVLFGGLTGYFMYQEYGEDKRKEWEQ